MINKFNEYVNEGLDKDTKQTLQDLRTELNLYKKCLSSIEYNIEHLKKGAYDYGEASEKLLSEIREMITDCRYKTQNIKKGK